MRRAGHHDSGRAWKLETGSPETFPRSILSQRQPNLPPPPLCRAQEVGFEATLNSEGPFASLMVVRENPTVQATIPASRVSECYSRQSSELRALVPFLSLREMDWGSEEQTMKESKWGLGRERTDGRPPVRFTER